VPELRAQRYIPAHRTCVPNLLVPSAHLFDNLLLFHLKRVASERDVDLPPCNTIDDLRNLGFDFATIVRPDDYSRADLDLLPHHVAGRTSVICAGLIEAVTLPYTICSFRPVDWFVKAVISASRHPQP
jgi:hypothetical protein